MKTNKEVLCNMCGLSCTLYLDIHGHHTENAGLIHADISGGFSSTPGNGDGALDDMTHYCFSLCEYCLDFIFTNCVIKPDVLEHGDQTLQPFIPAEHRVLTDDWRKYKEKFFVNKLKHDKARNIIKK